MKQIQDKFHISAASGYFSTREELDYFLTAVSYFHPALKFLTPLWHLYKSMLTDDDLCISGCAADPRSLMVLSSSNQLHVKNTIPYSQCLRLHCPYIDSSDFSRYQRQYASSSKNRGHPTFVIQGSL